MIIELFLIGLIVGFLFYEMVGISPGGVIAPAYFALYIYEPQRIIMTIVLSFLVLFLIKFLSKRLIIYGRRKLLLALLLSFVLKLVVDLYIQPISVIQIDMQSIGYIIPGLIANEMTRQSPVPTLLSLGIVTMLSYQIAQVI